MSPSPFLGELIGTLILVLLGDGVVAAVLLNKSKAQNGGWLLIATGWAMAVVVAVYVAVSLGAPGQLNPASTVMWAIASGDYSFLVPNIVAQCIGAFLGAMALWLMYLPHWGQTEDQGLKLACFSTGPAIRNSATNFLAEAIATTVFLLAVWAVFTKPVGIGAGVAPYVVGIFCYAIGCSLGGPTGYAINPARDLMPRIAHALLPIKNKGPSDWKYSWVPVAGPLVGGAVVGLFVSLVK